MPVLVLPVVMVPSGLLINRRRQCWVPQVSMRPSVGMAVDTPSVLVCQRVMHTPMMCDQTAFSNWPPTCCRCSPAIPPRSQRHSRARPVSGRKNPCLGVGASGYRAAAGRILNALEAGKRSTTIEGNLIENDSYGIWTTPGVTATTSSPANTFIGVGTPIFTAP
jgi:hypothetical protein